MRVKAALEPPSDVDRPCGLCGKPLGTGDNRRRYHPACAKVAQARQAATNAARRSKCPRCGYSLNKSGKQRTRTTTKENA